MIRSEIQIVNQTCGVGRRFASRSNHWSTTFRDGDSRICYWTISAADCERKPDWRAFHLAAKISQPSIESGELAGTDELELESEVVAHVQEAAVRRNGQLVRCQTGRDVAKQGRLVPERGTGIDHREGARLRRRRGVVVIADDDPLAAVDQGDADRLSPDLDLGDQ